MKISTTSMMYVAENTPDIDIYEEDINESELNKLYKDMNFLKLVHIANTIQEELESKDCFSGRMGESLHRYSHAKLAWHKDAWHKTTDEVHYSAMGLIITAIKDYNLNKNPHGEKQK